MINRRTKISIFSATWVALLAVTAHGQRDTLGPVPAAAPLIPDARPVRSCESLVEVALPNTTIESAAVESNACRVTAVSTHPPAGDRVTIWVGIPMSGWNGRFLGTGGGGFSGGNPNSVSRAAALGYAAGATDTGHEGRSGSFALGDDGRLNWQLIRNNAHVGIHEMTVIGKSLTKALYRQAPRYSYFSGCSTGGRQGLMEAQRYPEDYDGIVSGAPAINWPKLHMQQFWGPLLMNTEDNPVASCKLNAATAAAVESCDAIDGVEDGVLADPRRCDYDPGELKGTSLECGTFSETDASIIRRIWLGPRDTNGRVLGYGTPRGTDLNPLSRTRGDPLQPQLLSITLDWFRYFLTQDPDFDWTTVTRDSYERFWEQSTEQFAMVIATDNPDLMAFRDRGGKAIVWHGWADPLITAYGTTDYYDRVTRMMGGRQATRDFIRLFMAPGVAHCGSRGNGPTPSGQLKALIDWVEEGDAPDTLSAEIRREGKVIRTRPLCPYPEVARYRGRGSTDEAGNFVCSDDF